MKPKRWAAWRQWGCFRPSASYGVRRPDDGQVYAGCVPDLTNDLHALVLDRGAIGVGVCGAHPFMDVRDTITHRVRLGYSGGMRFTFANPERATDVRSSYPWAERFLL